MLTTTKELARAYMHTMPLAVPGERGHDKTFRVACVLIHGFDLPSEDAIALMREYNNRLSAPWTEAELLHKLDGAAASPDHRLAAGYLVRRMRPRFTPVAPAPPILWKAGTANQRGRPQGAPTLSRGDRTAPAGPRKYSDGRAQT